MGDNAMNRFDIECALVWVEDNLENADEKGNIDACAIEEQVSRLFAENEQGDADPTEVQELRDLIESQL